MTLSEGEAAREQAFVEIGMQQHLFGPAELEAARASGLPLAEGLMALDVLDEETLDGLERAVTYRVGRREDKRLARLIVEHGYAAEDPVREALAQQKNLYHSGGHLVRLMNLLLDDEVLTESQYVAAQKLFRLEQG